MKRHLLLIFICCFIGVFSIKGNVFSYDVVQDDDLSLIFDKTQSDIDFCLDAAGSGSSVLPELQNSLPSPSFRVVTSQKKSQNNTNTIITRHFSAEVFPTKNYNCKFSSPLSSKENLIVIVRHLII